MAARAAQTLVRSPKKTSLGSMRMDSNQVRPTPYQMRYSANARPQRRVILRSRRRISAMPARFQTISYRNVGWNRVPSGRPAGEGGVSLGAASPHGGGGGGPDRSAV